MWSPDGTMLASGSVDKTIKLWDIQSGKVTSTLSGHSESVWSVAWNNVGSKLAIGSWDTTVRIWSVSSAGTFECQSTLYGHSSFVMSVAWNNDGTKLASGSYDKTVRIWSVGSAGTFECQSTLSGHNDPVWSVCFSPCGRKIVSGGGLGEDDEGNGDFSIRIWDAETGTQIGSPLTGHSDSVMSVAWNNDGTKLASGSFDRTARIWSVGSAGTFECQSTLTGHSK
jgi:WD40 repeat protein